MRLFLAVICLFLAGSACSQFKLTEENFRPIYLNFQFKVNIDKGLARDSLRFKLTIEPGRYGDFYLPENVVKFYTAEHNKYVFDFIELPSYLVNRDMVKLQSNQFVKLQIKMSVKIDKTTTYEKNYEVDAYAALSVKDRNEIPINDIGTIYVN